MLARSYMMLSLHLGYHFTTVESMADDGPESGKTEDGGLLGHARRVRERSGAAVGLAVRARERGTDTAVTMAVVTPTGEHRQTRRAFLGGSHGRTRAALAAAAVLFEALRAEGRCAIVRGERPPRGHRGR